MASPTVRQILDDTRRLMAQKQASVKGAEIVGQAPSSMPGAEHDSPVNGEAKKPQPETRDGTMVPNSGLSTAGAGDDSEKTRGHALEADESAESPTKKPAVTADANAKTAGVDDSQAGLANEILTLVRGAQKQAAAAPAAAPAAPAAAPVVDKQAAAPAAAAPAKPAAKQATAGLQMELTTDVMAKVAALVLSTEEGAVMVEQVLEKVAGAQMMRETLDFLATQASLAEKEAAYQAGEADAAALIQQQIYQQGLRDGATKQAQDLFFKMGQDMADASVGDMMGGGEGDMMGGGEGGMGGEEGGEGGEISIEQAMQILQQLVDSGELQPEEAQTIAQMLTGEGGGEGGEGGEGAPAEGGDAAAAAGAAAAPEGGEAAPASAGGAAEGGEDKKAAAAQSLLAAIQAVKAAGAKKV